MKMLALTALLTAGLAVPALADEHEAADEPDMPAAGEATLADCQVWLDQLGELIDVADPPVPEDVMNEAQERRDQVAQACDDGNYAEGMELASETIEMIEDAAEN